MRSLRVVQRLAVVVCVGLAACARTDHEVAGAASVTELTAAALPSRTSSDQTFLESDPGMTRAVERAIAKDPALSVSAKSVDVTVDRGVVSLRGWVVDHATRDELLAVVSAVPGVVRVDDDVRVSPFADAVETAGDDLVAFKLQRALHTDPSVRHDAERVTIDVVRGRVTLRGSTSDTATSAALERLVMETPGAAAVTNELRIRDD